MKTGPKTNGKVEILVAEDSPSESAQLAQLLERHGYSVTTAASGREALAAIERRAPALVITDIVMPGLDSYDLCKAIKADSKLRSIPVMLVTTLSDPQEVIRGLACGADQFLRKPWDERYLLSRIDYQLTNLDLRRQQKAQTGMEVDLGGKKHFIDSGRQQAVDLLISTYEQAVELNGELKLREEQLAHSNQVLNGLYRIADGLNHATSEQELVETVLERALELPGVQAGWISLRDGESGFRLAAARNLPPALEAPGAMDGDCTCRRCLLSGELDRVSNIMACERIGKASGDTRGLRYHASIPLWLGDRTLGVMNLVGPERGLFNDDELRVLYGIGNQVAVALERVHLHGNLTALVQERTAALEAEIVERKNVEKEQARLVAIIAATPDMVATGDLDGRVLYYNQAGLRMLGFEAGLDPSTVRFLDTHPDWAAKLVMEEGIPHAIEHGTWSGETALLRRDGREIPISQVIIAHKGSDGSVEYLSTIARDITERKQAEARLNASNERLRQITDNIHEVFWMSDAVKGEMLYISPAYEPIWGRTRDSLYASPQGWIDAIHVDDRQRVLLASRTKQVDGLYDEQYRIVKPDGSIRWIHDRAFPVRDGNGTVYRVVGVAEDVTLREENAKRIARLNRVYAVLSGINTTIVRTLDRQELFDEACRIAVELGGFKLAWIGLLDPNGLDVTPVAKAGVDEGYLDSIQLTARDDAPDRCEMVARALLENTAVVCNDIATDPQMARWREEALRRGYRSVVVLPLRLEDEVTGLLLLYASEAGVFDAEEMGLLTEIAGDISFALAHLKAGEAQSVQSAALNAAANAIAITDRAGTIEWVNRAFTVLTGYDAADVLGENPRLFKSGKHDRAFYQSLWETVLAGRTWRAETTNRRKDGSLYTEHQSITPVLGKSGAITHFVTIKEDITERLQMQAQLLQAQKMELVGQLAGGVAHDFNNLLCVILGWTGMALGDLPADSAIREPLHEIRSAGEAASSLTKQLLGFSRQQLVEPTFLSVNRLVAELDKMLRRLIGENIAVDIRTDPDIGTIKMDRGQLEQVLVNLVVNARDAMPAGGRLMIETANVVLDGEYPRKAADVTPGEYVMLAVSDTGTGMSEAVKARIFEPFFTTKAHDRGTGLGLATCYGIAKQAGGHLAAYSEEGIGTTMKVYLPRRSEAADTGPRRRRSTPTHGVETILLVEDEPAVRRVTARMLDAQGYKVVSTSGGEEALRIVEDGRERIDLLLTDVVLAGGMHGGTLAERARALRPTLKVLFASGYTSDVTILHGLLERGVALAHKPFTAESLARKVREVLDAK